MSMAIHGLQQMHLPGTEKSTATTLSNEADYIKAHIGATTH